MAEPLSRHAALTNAQRASIEVVEHLVDLDLGSIRFLREPDDGNDVVLVVSATSSAWNTNGDFILVVEPEGCVARSLHTGSHHE